MVIIFVQSCRYVRNGSIISDVYYTRPISERISLRGAEHLFRLQYHRNFADYARSISAEDIFVDNKDAYLFVCRVGYIFVARGAIQADKVNQSLLKHRKTVTFKSNWR